MSWLTWCEEPLPPCLRRGVEAGSGLPKSEVVADEPSATSVALALSGPNFTRGGQSRTFSPKQWPIFARLVSLLNACSLVGHADILSASTCLRTSGAGRDSRRCEERHRDRVASAQVWDLAIPPPPLQVTRGIAEIAKPAATRTAAYDLHGAQAGHGGLLWPLVPEHLLQLPLKEVKRGGSTTPTVWSGRRLRVARGAHLLRVSG